MPDRVHALGVAVALPMVQVRVVRVFVDQVLVAVWVGVRFARRIAKAVVVLVVLVVNVRVLVLHRLVGVLVFVALHEVQVEAHGHQGGGRDQCPRHRL